MFSNVCSAVDTLCEFQALWKKIVSTLKSLIEHLWDKTVVTDIISEIMLLESKKITYFFPYL